MPAVNAWQRPEGVLVALNGAPLEARQEEPEPEAGAAEPRPAGLPVGMVLEQAMTKAQKKNLHRRKKKAVAGAPGADAASEAGTAVTDASGDALCLDDWDAAAERLASAQAGGGDGFITDAARYRKLLGLHPDSDADSDDGGGDEAASGSGLSGDGEGRGLGDDGSLRLTASDSSDGGASPAAVLLPVAPVIAAFGGAGAGTTANEEAAMQAAVAASLREFECEQERQRQRAFLAAGAPAVVQLPVVVPVAAVAAASKAAPPPLTWQLSGDAGTPAPAFSFSPAPLAAPAAAAAPGAGYGLAYGAALAAQPVPAYMAAGHQLAAVAEEEDDDLDSLLALCGVAG